MFKLDLLFEPERRKLNTLVPLALDTAAMTRTMYLNGGYCEVVEAMIAIFNRGLTPLARTSHARPPGIKFPVSKLPLHVAEALRRRPWPISVSRRRRRVA